MRDEKVCQCCGAALVWVGSILSGSLECSDGCDLEAELAADIGEAQLAVVSVNRKLEAEDLARLILTADAEAIKRYSDAGYYGGLPQVNKKKSLKGEFLATEKEKAAADPQKTQIKAPKQHHPTPMDADYIYDGD